jgi:DME family drug/metabolite transporter
VVFTINAVLLAALLIGQNLTWLVQPRGWLVVLHLGVVTAAVGYVLFNLGIRTVSVSSAAALTLAEPLTASLLSIFLLGETHNLTVFAGVVLLLSGLIVLSLEINRVNFSK